MKCLLLHQVLGSLSFSALSHPTAAGSEVAMGRAYGRREPCLGWAEPFGPASEMFWLNQILKDIHPDPTKSSGWCSGYLQALHMDYGVITRPCCRCPEAALVGSGVTNNVIVTSQCSGEPCLCVAKAYWNLLYPVARCWGFRLGWRPFDSLWDGLWGTSTLPL